MPKEYIEREAVLDAMAEGQGKRNDIEARTAIEIWGKIKKIPAADVVEVVRCLNCVYWDGMGYEGRCEAPTNGLIREYTNYDDFCSYGERKDEGK